MIYQANSSLQRYNASRLSSVVDHLIVENVNLRGDIEQLKKAVIENRKRSRKKLVGPGVFSLEDLERIREAKGQGTSKSRK